MTPNHRIAAAIDHTLLKPGATLGEMSRLCNEAMENGFAAVCVPPLFVSHCAGLLKGSPAKLATVIGFPFGYCAVEAKLAECILAIVDGADELDVVINFTAIKNNDWTFVANEINHLLPLIREKQKTIKIIIESGILTDEEIVRCCELYGGAGVDFLKTSTGYASQGATVHAVALMRANLPPTVQIKASGGIRDTETALAMLEAGATRLGTSSGMQLVQGLAGGGHY